MTDKLINNIDNIVSCFNESRLNSININDNDEWSLPRKSTKDFNARIQYGDRISNNIAKYQSKTYDVTYLKNIFRKIDKALSDGIPFDVLEGGGGFVFPSSDYNVNMNYQQLTNHIYCNDFIDKTCDFKADFPKKGKDGITPYYLLGYVGSGKSTLLNYICNSRKDIFKEQGIVSVFFEYNEISEFLYKEDMNPKKWDKIIKDIVFEKIINNASEVEKPAFASSNNKLKEIKEIINKHNVMLCFDGFDSLSPNKIERRNAKIVLSSINKTLHQIAKLYTNKYRINCGCHLIYCLRKCTYESLESDQKFGRPDANNAYFLPAPKFEAVIKSIIDILSLDKNKFIKKHQNHISEIIEKTSLKADTMLEKLSDSQNDFFDNNYRRRLRYVSSVIIVHALRLSNHFRYRSTSTDEDIHESFFKELKEQITSSKKDHLFIDILVYGVNTGFNNHFSASRSDDNLGKLCGFVDNIFWYFCDVNPAIRNENNILLKLRVLQLLNKNKEDGSFNYMSKKHLLQELKKIGYSINDVDLSNILDFLEKSLFVRSSILYKEINPDIQFKCSNFGHLLLNNILCDYSYLSAVCQNTCLPTNISNKIEYKRKTLSGSGTDFFIDKKWIILIIPYLIYFLRIIKTIELNNDNDKDFHIHKTMIENCKSTIDIILSSKNNKLTSSDMEEMERACTRALDFN